MLHQSYFKDSFKEAFKSDFIKDSIIVNGTKEGENHGLTFYLLDTSFRRLGASGIGEKAFQLQLSSKDDYFNMFERSKVISYGKHVTWKVQALEVIPSDDLQGIPIQKRKCRFPDETDGLKIFKVYSRKACEFECRIKKAYKKCKCHPWYIPPTPSSRRHILCELDGNFCFDTVMNSEEAFGECTCLPTCHHIEFPYVEYVKPLKMNCKDLRPLVDELMSNGYNELLHVFFEESEWDGNKVRKLLCEEIRSNMAKVTIMFERGNFIRTRTSLKVTSTDKLAAFGKFGQQVFAIKNNQLTKYMKYLV